jgi:maleylpyruvate isomerase
VKLYSYYRSSSAWRVRIALHYKQIPFEYVAVDLSPTHRAQDAEGFASVNPFRQVPILEWTEGGAVRRLTQSVAILEYLEETRPEPALLPRDPLLRARVREAVEIVNSGIQPLHNTSVLGKIRGIAGDPAALAFARGALETGLPALQALHRAHGGRFCVGDDPTLADVYLVPALAAARRFEADLRPFSDLLSVEATVSAFDAFRKAHADVQPDAPRTGGSA